MVKYIETHVGHEMEVRAERLSKNDQEYLLEQLQAGVSHERILKNARDIKNGEEFSKLNFTTRKDLNNLAYRYNIDKVRHHNDLIATSLKVNEWNSDGKNYGFLFKQIGTYIYFTSEKVCFYISHYCIFLSMSRVVKEFI